ncbi:MAG TPA: LD-carboxypeptidase, partial [bacterium]|nr:LD-carboxypeptidase [bacterium]
FNLIQRNPKIFIGYSDITALHLAIHQNTGLVTFHAPVPLSAFTDYTQQHFVPALTEAKPLGLAYVALATASGTHVFKHSPLPFSIERLAFKERLSQFALDRLRHYLIGLSV